VQQHEIVHFGENFYMRRKYGKVMQKEAVTKGLLLGTAPTLATDSSPEGLTALTTIVQFHSMTDITSSSQIQPLGFSVSEAMHLLEVLQNSFVKYGFRAQRGRAARLLMQVVWIQLPG
jgi:hypothetical protein